METNEKQYEIGENVELGGKQYVITGLDAKGAYILKTPYEIRRDQNKRYNINDEVILDGLPHFITEIVDGQFILKTFKEIYDESCCKVCKSFCKDKGWMPKERINPNDKMPLVFGCKLGQFEQSHKVTCLKKQCNMKNYIYEPRKAIRAEIERVIKECPLKMSSVSKIMRPIKPMDILGVEVIDCEKECVTISHPENFRELRE
jgi:hypothetical protein